MPSVVIDPATQPLGVRRHGITYASPSEAFDDGNYGYAAQHADDDPRLRGAALIMMGHYEGGLPLLERCEDPASCYYRAVALWGYGETAEALSWIRQAHRHLDGESLLQRRLQILEGLIQGGPIRVLVQARNAAPPSSFGILSAMKRAKGFDVRSVGYQDSDDCRIEPYVGIGAVLAALPSGWAPHFFHCYQVESNLMPTGLERAAFPIIGYVSDYDTRVHTCYYRARVCDALIVSGSIDHSEVRRGFGLPAVVFPKAVGICASAFATLDVTRKDHDLFCSGTSMTFYQNDKGTLLYRLTQLPEAYRIRIVQGFFESNAYLRELARTRTVFSFVRRQPVWSSRALEALAGGAVALYQKGAGLELFFDESEGAIPYTEPTLEQVVMHVIDHWDDVYARAAQRGRARVLREFDIDLCMERYLKRLALLSAEIVQAPRRPKAVPIEATLRYPPTARGSFVASSSIRRRVRHQAFAQTVERVEAMPPAEWGGNVANVLAFASYMMGHRDSDLDRLEWKLTPHATTAACLTKAVDALEAATRRDADDLLLWFNLGRLCYYTGSSERAYAAFGRVVRMTEARINPLMDLYGEDFGEANFPFRDYVDHLWRYLATKDSQWLQALVAIVVASAWIYRSLLEVKRGDTRQALHSAEQAIRRHPHSAWYHEHYANLLWPRSKHNQAAGRLALRHLQLALDISPYCSGLLAKCIVWMHRAGDDEAARRRLQAYERLAQRTEGLVSPETESKLLARVRAQLQDRVFAGAAG